MKLFIVYDQWPRKHTKDKQSEVVVAAAAIDIAAIMYIERKKRDESIMIYLRLHFTDTNVYGVSAQLESSTSLSRDREWQFIILTFYTRHMQ